MSFHLIKINKNEKQKKKTPFPWHILTCYRIKSFATGNVFQALMHLSILKQCQITDDIK